MISDVLKEVEDKAVSANEAEWVVRDNLDEDNVYICCSNCTMTFTFDKDELVFLAKKGSDVMGYVNYSLYNNT